MTIDAVITCHYYELQLMNRKPELTVRARDARIDPLRWITK